MAIRSKTPARRGGPISSQGEAALAKPKARRARPAAEQLEPQDAAPDAPAPGPQEVPRDPIERQPAAEAIKALGTLIAAGIDALADLRAEVREVSRRLDQLAAGRAGQAAPVASDADEYPFGRDRDPGDAVPPGVATMTPTPLTENDEAVLHTLEELPKRAGRRGPRAKAHTGSPSG